MLFVSNDDPMICCHTGAHSPPTGQGWELQLQVTIDHPQCSMSKLWMPSWPSDFTVTNQNIENGKNVVNTTSYIYLLVLEKSTAGIFLGQPWLIKHQPVLSWQHGKILKWGCFPTCFLKLTLQAPTPSVPVWSISIESSVEQQSVNIPECCSYFSDVLYLKKASQQPPHWPWDCVIIIILGVTVPRGQIYLLSIPEQKVTEVYIVMPRWQEVNCHYRSPGAS